MITSPMIYGFSKRFVMFEKYNDTHYAPQVHVMHMFSLCIREENYRYIRYFYTKKENNQTQILAEFDTDNKICRLSQNLIWDIVKSSMSTKEDKIARKIIRKALNKLNLPIVHVNQYGLINSDIR
jgi:hypothetical protein